MTRTQLTAKKRQVFLEALRESSVIVKACEMANISRQTAYDWRNADVAFAAEWDRVLVEAIEDLEREARRRALVGVEKAVWHKGVEVGTEIQYSDTMLIFLLKAAKPEKYRENSRIEHTGANGGPIQIEDKAQRVKAYQQLCEADGAPVPTEEQALQELAVIAPQLVTSDAVH